MTDALPRGARLGVDVGSVRVGLAASDPDGLVATPVETLARDAEHADGTLPTDLVRIASEVGERAAAVVYVGLPRHLKGTEGAAAEAARSYAERLAALRSGLSVAFVDERMTSVAAERAVRGSGRAGRKHRAVVDQVAAVIILQTALDGERGSARRSGILVDVPAPTDD